jgi:hypothetical protein
MRLLPRLSAPSALHRPLPCLAAYTTGAPRAQWQACVYVAPSAPLTCCDPSLRLLRIDLSSEATRHVGIWMNFFAGESTQRKRKICTQGHRSRITACAHSVTVLANLMLVVQNSQGGRAKPNQLESALGVTDRIKVPSVCIYCVYIYTASVV